MISHNELKKGVRIIIDDEPYEILESMPLKVAQRRVVIQTKIKNLISGNVFDRNFHQGDVFEEPEIIKFQAKFIYNHQGRYVFCDATNPSKRFELTEEKIGEAAKFLKPSQLVDGLIFKEKIINILLPIKIALKVAEAPPGVRGDRAQGGTKTVKLETGAEITTPLFIETGDIVEVNTEKGEYVRRI